MHFEVKDVFYIIYIIDIPNNIFYITLCYDSNNILIDTLDILIDTPIGLCNTI